jgi:SecD/SecF fusion protein
LTSEGGEKFGEHSGASIGRYLCIVLDKVVLSCPVIQARIDTNGTITLGNNDLTSAQALAIQLRYGSLPVALDVIENRTVGPTLGQDSVQRSVRAGTIGLIVVVLFMLVYYRLPGVVAGLALVLYGLMNFGLYKLLPVTLTLPAVTGFILSVGMAVDANILVFERMKEELRSGRSMNRSMELGFIRAWPSIRDSAISTLITCVILFWFGSNFGASVVKGFAITLALGVITNIFTAVTVTRALLRFMVALAGEGLEKNSFLMGFNLESQGQAPGLVTGLMDIVGQRKLYFVFSMITILLGIGAMVASFVDYGSPLKLSVDFTSGSLMELQFAETVPPEDVRQVFANYQYVDPETNVPIEFKDTDVTTAEQLGQETILIRSKFLQEDIHTEILQEIRTEIGDFTELRFDSVGPAIGQEVGRAGGFAVLIASIAILLFLMFAFRLVANPFRYGMAAVVAMAHDILVTAGVFALCGIFLGWEVDALFLTAILTVIGYSVHDTIIVFDRLRENVPLRRGESFEVVCNRSILETLNRSIVTSLSTMFVVISILVFGGSTIQQFVAILLLGIVSGTYSSIFIAVPLLVAWETGEIGQLFGQGDNHSMEKATV